MGKRLTVWIPTGELWIFDVLKNIQYKAEKKGVPLSQGDIVRMYLCPALEKYLGKENDEETDDIIS